MSRLKLVIMVFLLNFTMSFGQEFTSIGKTTNNINDFCFSPKGSTVFISENTFLKAYNVKNRNEISVVHNRHTKPITSICISYDSSIVVTAGKDSSVIVYNLKKKIPIFSYKHTAFVSAVSLSLDASYLVSGDANGSLIVFSMKEQKIIHSASLHQGLVSAIAINPDNSFAATVGIDGSVNILQLNTYKSSQLYNSNTSIFDCAINRDANYLIAACANGKLLRWRINTENLKLVDEKRFSFSWLVSCNWHPSDNTYIVADVNGKIIISADLVKYKYNLRKKINKVLFIPQSNKQLVIGASEHFNGLRIIPAKKLKMNSSY